MSWVFFSGAQETGDPVGWAGMLVGEKHDDYMVAEEDWGKNITKLALGVGSNGASNGCESEDYYKFLLQVTTDEILVG